MGRYDKIKVFNGSNWYKPNYIRVFNGSGFLDLGADGSDINKPLYVYNGSAMLRATLNRTVTTYYNEAYTIGRFRILPVGQWCLNPTKFAWNFSCTAMKTQDVDVNLFNSYSATGGNGKTIVTWLADGRIKVYCQSYSGASGTRYSSNYVGKNVRVNIRVYWNKGSTTCYIVFNGVTTSSSFHYAYEISNATNVVGDGLLMLYGNVSVTGVKYSGSVATTTFNASSTAAVDLNRRTVIDCSVVTPSYTVVTWT